LKVRVDVTEFDRIYLPVQTRRLIHPYSDIAECATDIRCIKLEEALADKLKCLLQRRYSHDLFDLVHAVFVRNALAIDRQEIVSTFLKKTIFEPSPVAALNLLLATPFELMRGFWQKIVSPRVSALSFDQALQLFKDGLAGLFEQFSYGHHLQLAYFPAALRTPILQAGSDRTLLRLTYHGVTRIVEPYSLVFKRRSSDGVAQEYFYAWDRTGGRTSGPGIKAFMNYDIENLELTEEHFEPRYEEELGDAGATIGSFAAQQRSGLLRRGARSYRPRSSQTYRVRCTYCGKLFTRRTRNARLNPHKDRYGNACYGRIGMLEW
jgi:hypothetical protein